MQTLNIQKENIRNIIDKTITCLRGGGVIIIPTDTVYGLSCDAKNTAAIKKIFTIKARPEQKSLPIFISSFAMLDDVAYVKDERVLNFLKKIWPGALTAILPARGWMPLDVRGRELTIGVRMPDYHLALDIIKEFDGPITGTSANLSGYSASGKIDEVLSQFKHMPFKPDLVLDAGDLPESEPSTVVDCTSWPPKILRAGAISENEIKDLLKYN